MKKIKSLFLIGVAALLATVTTQLNAQVLTIGQPFEVNGQVFLISTNADGQYSISTMGPAGTNTVTVPMNSATAEQEILQIVQNNNPANADFYTTNEIELRIGAAYLQNSGQAAGLISLTKWGLLKTAPNLGIEGGLLQGNSNGTSGTAGAYGALDYRRPIGDVAFVAGIGGGYDNYNNEAFALLKGGVEYRQNKHLGEFVDLNYSLEKQGNQSRGFGFAAGIEYAF